MCFGGGGGGGKASPPRRANAPGFVFEKQDKFDELEAETDHGKFELDGGEFDQSGHDQATAVFREISQERNRAQRKFDDEFYAAADKTKAAEDAKKDGLPNQVSIDNPEIKKARDAEKADASNATGRDDTILATPTVAVPGNRGTQTGAQAPIVRDPLGARGAPADAAGGGRNSMFGTSDPDRGQGRRSRGLGRNQMTGAWRRPPRGGRGRPDKALIVDTGVVTTGKTLLGQ